MPSDWLAARRTEVAAERILDAAGELFARHDAANVGMHEIASAAGCSRATLYRYFPNRDSLHTAYVHRETQRVYRQLTEAIGGIHDPRRRVVEGMLTALRAVRDNPALASWFAAGERPIGGEMAGRSEVINALVEAFVGSLGGHDVERRARWLIRVMTSLLMFPGRDDADERAMLEDFVAPVIVSTAPAHRGLAGCPTGNG